MSVLHIAKTGLDSSRKALETTGHNVANVGTEGYSRQRVRQNTAPPLHKEGIATGRGSVVVDVERIEDPILERRLQRNSSDLSYYSERKVQLEKVEGIFTDEGIEGLNNLLNKFYNAFRELASNPENENIRSVVRDMAQKVAQDFGRIRKMLDEYASDIDRQIKIEIGNVNSILERITKLNRDIMRFESSGADGPDLKDKRDLAINELAKLFKIRTYLDSKGHYNVMAENVGSLVMGGFYQKLSTSFRTQGGRDSQAPGEMNISIEINPNRIIDEKFKGGMIEGLIRVRNKDIRHFQNSIDQIAFQFVNTVNSVHQRGYANRAIRRDEKGDSSASDSKGRTTDINFFKPIDQIKDASLKVELSKEVQGDLSNIVTALSPNSPGDNRVALAIGKLQHLPIMNGGTTTLEEAYLQSVAKIGVEVGKAKIDHEQAVGIFNQTKLLKDRLVGVSIDEETANMVRYQHAYNASAKVMQTAKEMFDTILEIKR